MSGMIGFKDHEAQLLEQNVPKQQLYFEVPFYLFTTVILAFLFVWRHFYEIVLVALEDDDVTYEEYDKRGSIINPDADRLGKKELIKQPLLDPNQKTREKIEELQLAEQERLKDEKIAKIDRRLSILFNLIGFIIISCLVANTFMNLLHYIDTEDSKQTARYSIGMMFYMTFFTFLALIQLGVAVFAF